MKTIHDNRTLCAGLVFCLGCLGCAEQNNLIDPNDGYQVIAAEYDAADCVENDICDNVFNPERDIFKAPFQGNRSSNATYPLGYFGYIDDECHSIRSHSGQPDVDIVGFDVTPGTPLRIVVSNASVNSPLSPVAYLLASTGADLMFSAKQGDSNATELRFLAPTSRFYISVESSDNAPSNGSIPCEPGKTHNGGSSYGYAVSVENLSQSDLVDSFGTISNKKEYRTKMGKIPGVAHYYKAKIEEGKKLNVDIKTSEVNALPTVSPIDCRQGFDWTLSGSALEKTYDASTKTANTTVSPEFADSDGYLWFVVSDFNANADYRYTVTVNPD